MCWNTACGWVDGAGGSSGVGGGEAAPQLGTVYTSQMGDTVAVVIRSSPEEDHWAVGRSVKSRL